VIHKIGVALCIAFTVYGQIAAKLAASQMGAFPEEWGARASYLARLLLNPFFISCFVAATLAALSWMVALSGLELSRAYPFMSLNFVAILVAGAWLFREPLTPAKILGTALIILGVIVGSSSR
jgi:multidrug transporter EmrE-like cation transporter